MKGKLEFVDVLVEILGDNVWLLVFDNYLLIIFCYIMKNYFMVVEVDLY